ARTFSIGAGGGIFDVAGAATNVLTLSTALTADANLLTKIGAGTLTLGAASARTGAVAINNGKLSATNLTAVGTGAVTVTGPNSNYEINTAAGNSSQVINLVDGGTFTWT